VRRGLFRPGHHAQRKRRAELRPREMHSLRRVPVELRLRFARKPGTHGRRLPRRDGRIALGGELAVAFRAGTGGLHSAEN
jgi:hypothetical protein